MARRLPVRPLGRTRNSDPGWYDHSCLVTRLSPRSRSLRPNILRAGSSATLGPLPRDHRRYLDWSATHRPHPFPRLAQRKRQVPRIISVSAHRLAAQREAASRDQWDRGRIATYRNLHSLRHRHHGPSDCRKPRQPKTHPQAPASRCHRRPRLARWNPDPPQPRQSFVDRILFGPRRPPARSRHPRQLCPQPDRLDRQLASRLHHCLHGRWNLQYPRPPLHAACVRRKAEGSRETELEHGSTGRPLHRPTNPLHCLRRLTLFTSCLSQPCASNKVSCTARCRKPMPVASHTLSKRASRLRGHLPLIFGSHRGNLKAPDALVLTFVVRERD